MNEVIQKGTKVMIRTTNGGEATVTLTREYVPTYPVWIEYEFGHQTVLMPCRIKSIMPVAA
jgi:hypothetical protein